MQKKIALWIGIGAICIFAIFLQSRHLEYTDFWGDQAATLAIALNWTRSGQFPLVANKSSIGLMNPPMVEYLQALALFVVQDILAVAWLTVLLNVGGLVVSAWIANRVWGWRVAVMTAGLYAVNPYLVYYGRMIWNQTLVPFFSALALAALLQYFALERRGIYLTLAIISLTILIQLHLTSAVLSVVIAVLCIVERKLRLWPIAAGLGISALLWTPFLVFEIQAGFPDVKALMEILHRPADLNLASILLTLNLVQARGLFQPYGAAATAWQTTGLPWINTDPWIAALLAAGVIYALAQRLWRHTDNRRATAMFILALWIGVPPLFFLRHSHYLQIYYFFYIYPAPLILLAAMADELYQGGDTIPAACKNACRWIWRIAGMGLFVTLAVIIIWQAAINLALQQVELQPSGDVLQIRHVRAGLLMATQVLDTFPDCRLIIVSDGYGWQSSMWGLTAAWVSPATAQFVRAGDGLIVPAQCAIYMITERDRFTHDWLNHYANPIPGAEIETPRGRVQFYKLDAEQAVQTQRLMDEGQAVCEWQNGVRLLAYQSPSEARPGASLPLTLTWQVNHAPDQQLYHFGHYLLTTEGALAAQYDGVGVESSQWKANDLFITRPRIELLPTLSGGPYRLEIGIYAYPQIQRVRLLNEADLCYLREVILVSD